MDTHIYQAHVLEHAKHPHNKGLHVSGGVCAQGRNPACGDSLTLCVYCEGGVIQDARFDGEGCAISQASASMLTEKVKGMKLEDAQKLSEDDMFALLQVPISPARYNCALLSLSAFKDALKKHT